MVWHCSVTPLWVWKWLTDTALYNLYDPKPVTQAANAALSANVEGTSAHRDTSRYKKTLISMWCTFILPTSRRFALHIFFICRFEVKYAIRFWRIISNLRSGVLRPFMFRNNTCRHAVTYTLHIHCNISLNGRGISSTEYLCLTGMLYVFCDSQNDSASPPTRIRAVGGFYFLINDFLWI